MGLESPFETMMFTSTFLQGCFIHFYLLFISHCSLLFCNKTAMHCKMFYANPSRQLHTTKTNYKVLHREKLQGSNWKLEVSKIVFSMTLSARFKQKKEKKHLKYKCLNWSNWLSLSKTNTLYIGFTKPAGTVKGYRIFYRFFKTVSAVQCLYFSGTMSQILRPRYETLSIPWQMVLTKGVSIWLICLT